MTPSGPSERQDDYTTGPGGSRPSVRGFCLEQIAVEVQQEVNLRRGVDLLAARNDIDPKRIAYVGHSCDATAGGFLSGIEKRFRAFVIMAGGLSDEVDKKTKAYEDYRNKVGPDKLDAFEAKYSWMDPGKYVAHSDPATMFLQYATDEPFLKPTSHGNTSRSLEAPRS